MVSQRRLSDAASLLRECVADGDCSSAASVRLAVGQLLQDVIECDEALWTEVRLERGAALVVPCHALEGARLLTQSLARHASEHPAVVSYMKPGDDRRPRRVSDTTSALAWQSCAAYVDGFRARGALHQLSLVTTLAPGFGAGWVLTRSVKDFSDDDVLLASFILPVATALQRGSAPPGVVPGSGPTILTPAEQQTLVLLAEGLSGRQIASARACSELTVRKHLEHLYAKLGCHDRLSAVVRGRRLGLLP